MNETLLLISFFCTVMFGITLAGYWVLHRTSGTVDISGNSRDAMAGALRTIGERLPQINTGKTETAKLLASAGYRWPGAEHIFNGITYATGAILALITAIVMTARDSFAEAIIPAICAAGLGYLLPKRFLQSRIRRRLRNIAEGLPVAMDLLVLSVEAGQTFDQALYDASKELRKAFPELSQEFATVFLALRASVSRSQVFRDLADRNKHPDIAKLTTLLLDSDRYGTSLGPALRTHARYLRIRRRQAAQEKARKIGVKLVFPIFFLIFPSVLLVTLGPAVMQIMDSFKALTAP